MRPLKLLRVSGWHFGGGSRAEESTSAPGILFCARSCRISSDLGLESRGYHNNVRIPAPVPLESMTWVSIVGLLTIKWWAYWKKSAVGAVGGCCPVYYK